MNRYSYTTDSTYREGQNLITSEKEMDESLISLIRVEIPEGRQNLKDSFSNLERVAEYCEDSYYRAENKKAALEETKNYTTQSLASVAYQINTLAYNYLQLLDLQANNLAEMESQMNHIAQTVMIHKEKVARREIGVLTANKVSTRQYKIVAPSNPEKPIKYVRKPIDYSLLDEVGHGILPGQKQQKHRISSSQGSIQAMQQPAQIPPPTTKPPTPPQGVRNISNTGTLGKSASNTGTLGKSSRGEYRTPPVVIPPQVPSHYAPNYPIGHPRRSGGEQQQRGPGYSALPMPMPPSQVAAMHHNPTPQIGMVHPMQIPAQQLAHHQQPQHFEERHSINMPPPPAPHEMPELAQHHIGLHTLSRNMPRPGSQSPPLPPPPVEHDEHAEFGRPRQQSLVATIVPDDQNLPGWVPKNYIEKVVAIYDYYADKDDELSFQESSVLYVLKKNDDGWWEGVMDGVTGLFPGNYVEPCV